MFDIFNNPKMNIMMIVLLFIVLKYLSTSKELFEFPDYYPITYEKHITIDNKVNSTDNYDSSVGEIDSYDFSHLIRIMKQTKILANGDTKLTFNTPSLPVIKDTMPVEKVQPLSDHIVGLMNRLGDGMHVINVHKISGICKEETDFEMRISFDINATYYRVLNRTHYGEQRLRATKAKAEGTKNLYKISDVIIKGVIIASKAVIDDIFIDKAGNVDKIYVSKLYIMGLMDDQYLPGSNVTEFDLYWEHQRPLANRIIDERIIRDLKSRHQNEMNDLTRELPTHT
jgi:hypothetical protein